MNADVLDTSKKQDEYGVNAWMPTIIALAWSITAQQLHNQELQTQHFV